MILNSRRSSEVFIIPLVLAVIAIMINQEWVQAQHPAKPNVILILADDLGYGDLGCFGQREVPTPRIDGMARDGMRFMRHYSGSTVCAPSRCVLMTGKHTGHASVRGNNAVLMRDDELTLARLFKEAGYTTGCFGKWGIGHPPPYDDPQRKGFDHFYGYINMWHAHNFWPEFLIEDGKKVSLPNQVLDSYNEPADKEGRGVATEKKAYAPHLITEKALSFIENNQKNPFFLYFALNMPHANNEAGGDPAAGFNGMEVPDYGPFSDRDWPEPEKGFASMMGLVDNYVGQVLDKLEALSIAENTLVIFTSDNGPHQEGNHKMEFFNSNGQFRGMKRDLYEGGVRVPMIAWWPGSIRSGEVTNHMSAFQDYLPTFAEILKVPAIAGTDGISMLPTLLGKNSQQKSHPYLYWEFHEKGGRQSVIAGDFKGVRYNMLNNPNAPIEIYNISDDPREEFNLASRFPDKVSEFQSIMEESHADPE